MMYIRIEDWRSVIILLVPCSLLLVPSAAAANALRMADDVPRPPSHHSTSHRGVQEPDCRIQCRNPRLLETHETRTRPRMHIAAPGDLEKPAINDV
ncbi:hypothetical protein HD806DRAFT_514623 [Xylariaceae sp. AK1471]|nr:hypothetical protein HD806DRAFT_514623 [Xylariaceae sp. AK1471]